jgi:putative endonuclease
MLYVYLLESLKDKSWYIGYSEDLRKRLERHNKGENEYTKNKAPWKLVYYEAYLNKLDALGREKFLKSGSGRKFLKKQLNNYLKDDLPL